MKKQMPHTKADRPVFAPSFRPTPVSGERIIGGPKDKKKSQENKEKIKKCKFVEIKKKWWM